MQNPRGKKFPWRILVGAVLVFLAITAVGFATVTFQSTQAKIASLQASEVGQEYLLPDAPYPAVVRIEKIDPAVPVLGAHIAAKASVKVLLPPGSKSWRPIRLEDKSYYLGFAIIFIDPDGIPRIWTFPATDYWDLGRGYIINELGDISAAPVSP